MFCVIRNGQYLETETKLFGDLDVPKKPHEKAIFSNGEWIINADQLFKELDIKDAHEFLNNTDTWALCPEILIHLVWSGTKSSLF